MTTLTTNLFLNKALRTLCCAGALAVCPAWGVVVTPPLNAGGTAGDIGGTKVLSRSGYASQSPAHSGQTDKSLLFAATNTLGRPATELDEAMARTGFDEQSMSAPSVQFAPAPKGSTDVSVVSTANVGVVPVPEMSALFPIVGLIVAVSCTQILRRRRAAQQSIFRRLG